MNWNKALTNTEYWFVAIFLLAYLLFFIRTYKLSKALGSMPRAILLKFFLRAGYIGLIITAGLGPLIGTNIGKNAIVNSDELPEAYFLVDVSQSMTTADITPNRLEYFKLMLLEQLNNNQAYQLGLIIFSDEAELHCPLTIDYEAFKLFLQSVNTTLLDDKNPSKNFDKALSLATEKLANRESINKNIVVFTDNTLPVVLSEQTLKQIKKTNTQVFWLNIGKASPLPNNPITPYIYYEVEHKKNTIKDVFNEIGERPLRQNKASFYQPISSRSDRYYIFLGIALVLIMLDILFTIRIFKV